MVVINKAMERCMGKSKEQGHSQPRRVGSVERAVQRNCGINIAEPNPFNSSRRIAVEQTFLSVQNGQTGMSDLPVTIEIYDLLGNIVAPPFKT